jgi:hypothetical protein
MGAPIKSSRELRAEKEAKEAQEAKEAKQAFLGKKYKPVGVKVRPVYQMVPEKYRVIRKITGNPLEDMPGLSPHPADYCPTGRYTQERKDIMDKIHNDDFLWPEERKLLHHFMMLQEKGFAWVDSERGNFKHEFFPPVEFPVTEHEPWIEKSIPIPRGQLEEVCRIIKAKIDAGVYERSNSSYRTKFFGVVKKDGKTIRLVHSLEPLNKVTIAHSGVPPGTDELASHFAGRACGGCLDLYSGYDHRDIAEGSRDYTTFQTPFGALRLVKLPMGWTNSVPIFHEDVTYILEDEIPNITIPYIDDVAVRGPGSRYELPGGGYETHPENPGIRRFVWEHFQNLNRVVQRVKYAGGTFSGLKTILCANEFSVVGHICSYEGRKPSTDRIGAILRWPTLKDAAGIRQFLGTVGVMRMFMKDFGKIARPLQKLSSGLKEFIWGKAEQDSFDAIKKLAQEAKCLKPINPNGGKVVLAVDTSYMAVGIQIYQEDEIDPKIHYYAKFSSIPLNDREARFSQPKRELYGLKRALQGMQYWLLGVRKLVVETDALYIKGMLSNPGMGPNATINRWIEEILMFHFTLRHVPGKGFPADGLSRREPQPGDEVFPNRDEGLDEYPPPEDDSDWDREGQQPLDLEDFKDEIDTRGGYLHTMEGVATSIRDFNEEIVSANLFECAISEQVEQAYKDENIPMPQYLVKVKRAVLPEEPLLPDISLRNDDDKREPYMEDHRTQMGRTLDERLKLVKIWYEDTLVRPEGYETNKEFRKFLTFTRKFFIDKEGRLYRRGDENSTHKLVVDKEHRMFMMRSAHDSLGHKGLYATKSLIELRFWWPEFERDLDWYIKSCVLCQHRQKTLLRIPPVPTTTPSLFQKIHTDVMVMGEPSNQCKLVVMARDSLSRWPEGRALRADNAEALGRFLLEEVICRWGCPKWIVTDNAGQFIAALKWLAAKYGIIGIRISAYNSQANGPVERGHWDIRQSIYKATGGDARKWFWFFPQMLWAERITTRRGLGCSPFFAVTGAHPILPLDIEEATWLVEYPDRMLSTGELIGLRAQALAKHIQHQEIMRSRVDAEKLAAVRKYIRDHERTIKDYNFEQGDLVLIRNTSVEKSLDSKMDTRYFGPLIVVRRTKGGSYLCCELDGALFQGKIAQFRVVPFFQRKKITLPPNFLELIGVTNKELDILAEEDEPDLYKGKDLHFGKVRLNLPGSEEEEGSDSSEPYESEIWKPLESDETEVEYNAENPRRSSRKKA